MSDLASLSDEEILSRIQKGREPAVMPAPSQLSDDELLAKLGRNPVDQTFGQRVAGGARAFGAGTVKGLGDVARGFGILEQMSEQEKAEFDALSKQYPEATVGEIVGQVAPWLVPGTAAARIASLPLRALASGAVGAGEGFVVTKGQGGSNAEAAGMAALGATLGSGFEVLAPVINRGARAVGNALGLGGKKLLTDLGRPTAEFQAALDKAGISFDDIQQSALTTIKKLPSGTDPAQAARMARFETEGILPTAGQITQDFAQQAREARLSSMASGETGDPLRQAMLVQSQTFQKRIDDFVSTLGVPDTAGETIKEALSGRKTLLRNQKNALYKQVAEAAPEVARAPILTDTIEAAIKDPATKRRIARLAPTQASALDELMIEFGLNKNAEEVNKFIEAGGEVSPLTLGNFEDFRQALNLIERTDQTGAISVLTGPIKGALDEEVALIDDAVQRSGLSDTGVLNTLKEARDRVRELKTEFSPQAITGRLIGKKTDNFTPVIEASQVTQQLLRPNAPIEQLSAVLNNLSRAGERGVKAIGDLQAATVLQAMDAALKAPSRKTDGVQTFGGNQFAKALDSIGDDKLALIFKGNEPALRRLKNLRQIALDLEPTAGAVPRGSAPVILDALNNIAPGSSAMSILNVGRIVSKAGADERAVARALKGKPEVVEQARQITRLYPNLAAALGLGVIMNVDTENE